MAKRDALRQKLKAAERRRQRRQTDSRQVVQPQQATGTTSSEATPKVDVAGLIVRTILEFTGGPDSDARDLMVVAALKSVLRGSTPNGDDAKRLAEQLSTLPSHPGVSMRGFRDALQQLLTLANAHHDPRRSDAFLTYLSMLAE